MMEGLSLFNMIGNMLQIMVVVLVLPGVGFFYGQLEIEGECPGRDVSVVLNFHY